MRVFFVSMLLVLVMPVTVGAAETEKEIEYLLDAVGSSGCTFIRNGRRHDADDAEDHLRMKYRRGKRYAPTTEKFIERLASASSMSKKPYYIECPGDEAVPTGEWLTAQLEGFRSTQPASL